MSRQPYSLRLVQCMMLIIIVTLIYMMALVLQPFNAIKMTVPVQVVNKEVKHGEPVVLNLSYCIKKNTTSRLDIQLVNSKSGTIYTLFALDSLQLKPGCQNDVKFPIDSNRFSTYLIMTGDYQIRLRTISRVNAIKNSTLDFDSEKFHYIH